MSLSYEQRLYNKLSSIVKTNTKVLGLTIPIKNFFSLNSEVGYIPTQNVFTGGIHFEFLYQSITYTIRAVELLPISDDINYPYVDLDNYYEKADKQYNPNQYCSHSWATYEGFSEKYSYCVYCNKTEEEILKR